MEGAVATAAPSVFFGLRGFPGKSDLHTSVTDIIHTHCNQVACDSDWSKGLTSETRG
jgi:hypothetical protein